MNLSAHWMKYFMFGASVWPPSCCRHASSPSQVTLIHRGHLRRVIIPLDVETFSAKQRKHPACVHRRHEASLMIEPVSIALFRNPVADEGEARRAERNQFVGIDGNIAGRLAAKS